MNEKTDRQQADIPDEEKDALHEELMQFCDEDFIDYAMLLALIIERAPADAKHLLKQCRKVKTEKLGA